ncbi:hypothetical protein ACHFCA_25720 [Delftia tsuruhatensis]
MSTDTSPLARAAAEFPAMSRGRRARRRRCKASAWSTSRTSSPARWPP